MQVAPHSSLRRSVGWSVKQSFELAQLRGLQPFLPRQCTGGIGRDTSLKRQRQGKYFGGDNDDFQTKLDIGTAVKKLPYTCINDISKVSSALFVLALHFV